MTSSSELELPLLTFNSLYNLLREEKKLQVLQEIPEKFYEALDKFLESKREEVFSLKRNGDLHSFAKQKLILKNTEKISKELLNLRCIKIANIGIKNELFNEEILNSSELLSKEADFMIGVKSLVKKIKLKNGNKL